LPSQSSALQSTPLKPRLDPQSPLLFHAGGVTDEPLLLKRMQNKTLQR
jgi:hypothetical protein